MVAQEKIQERAVGRWHHILPAVGVPAAHLSGKHGPCPLCGGKDRWRFDNKGGKGTFICSHCGAGSGVDLVMRFCKVQFAEARRMIEKHLPDAPIVVPKARSSTPTKYLDNGWSGALPLDGSDIASRYLKARGIHTTPAANAVRYSNRVGYKHEDGRRTFHPAMIARVMGADDASFTLHYTYLHDSKPAKADLPKQRLNAAARFPEGGAVRLGRQAAIMGIAEGIETALSAEMLYGIPTWAALSTAGLAKWQPPSEAREIIIFADADSGFAGEHAAYALAQRLHAAGYEVEVRAPKIRGTDWNDVLMAKRKSKAEVWHA